MENKNILAKSALAVFGKGNEFNESNIHNIVESDFSTRVGMAEYLAKSTLVPQAFRSNPADIYMAAGMANQMGMDLSIVLQNLDIIKGKIGWKSTFVIALINKSGRFASRLMFEYANSPKNFGTIPENWACRAYTKEHDGTITYGSWISIDMAKKEGWFGKTGSKWNTMPEQMLMYRAAAFFGRIHCSDLLNGFQHIDEIIDYSDVTPQTVNASNNTIPENVNESVSVIEAKIESPKTIQKEVQPKKDDNKSDELTIERITESAESSGFFVNDPREKNGKVWLIVEPIPFAGDINYDFLNELGFCKSKTTDSYALEITHIRES